MKIIFKEFNGEITYLLKLNLNYVKKKMMMILVTYDLTMQFYMIQFKMYFLRDRDI